MIFMAFFKKGVVTMKLEMKKIYKSFGENDVLKDVSITVDEGEIYALLGENGAGKSTLMNILGGVLQPNQGKIFIDGEEIKFATPADSLHAGIAFIHQELNLVNDLKVYENMFIGRELKNKRGFVDHVEMISQTKEIFNRIGIDINPLDYVRSLDASYKQFIEIARALMMKASIIIMDEPTTSLTEPEIKRVFKVMESLRQQGVSLIFISHKLNEVLEICSQYVVLRDGNFVAAGQVEEVTVKELACFMVGHEVRHEKLNREVKIGKEILAIRNCTLRPYYKNIDMELKRGEIIGVTGLLGDGRSELFQSVFGDYHFESGEILIDNKAMKKMTPTKAIKLGIGYIPRNRKENGIIKDMSILENASLVALKQWKKKGLLDGKLALQSFNEQKEQLQIKMGSEKKLITSLSGGNQQKVVLAKWLAINPKILILDNPTQGVDVGAKEEIYDIILRLAEKGVAIVVLSSEAQEIIRLCDRAYVMYHGRIHAEIKDEQMTEQVIMTYATGGQRQERGQK